MLLITVSQDDRHNREFSEYPAPKSIGLRLGDPGLDGLDVAQPGLERPPNKADAPSGVGHSPVKGSWVCV